MVELGNRNAVYRNRDDVVHESVLEAEHLEDIVVIPKMAIVSSKHEMVDGGCKVVLALVTAVGRLFPNLVYLAQQVDGIEVV